MIIPLFKPIGASSHQLAQKAGKLYSEKATHTGTLDPIASGVLTVLTGNDRFSKEKYASVQKQYVCTVLLGYATDSHDILGRITDSLQVDNTSIELWNSEIARLVGSHKQRMPHFSAKRHQGKSFFSLARQGKADLLPVISVKIVITEAEVLETRSLSSQAVLATICTTIAAVHGDFRQEEIIPQWKKVLTHSPIIHTISFRVTCTKRTYIRAIVRDLGKKTHLPGTVLSLERVANGAFSIEDCLCLI